MNHESKQISVNLQTSYSRLQTILWLIFPVAVICVAEFIASL
jgi:hypothetical protein